MYWKSAIFTHVEESDTFILSIMYLTLSLCLVTEMENILILPGGGGGKSSYLISLFKEFVLNN